MTHRNAQKITRTELVVRGAQEWKALLFLLFRQKMDQNGDAFSPPAMSKLNLNIQPQVILGRRQGKDHLKMPLPPSTDQLIFQVQKLAIQREELLLNED